MFKQFQMQVLEALREAGIDADATELVEPPEDRGDTGYPCFSAAKKRGESPVELAKEAEETDISGFEYIARAEAAGPYINFYLDWERFAADTVEAIDTGGDSYGSGDSFTDTYMVEYAQPNTHKAFHIGHVRNIALGEALCRVFEAAGREVVRTNYQGDVGPHVAKCLWALENLGEEPPKDDAEKGMWLGEMYAAASKEVEANPELEEEIKELTTKLYNRDESVMELWEETRQWSLDYLDTIYGDFGTDFDRLYFESETSKPGLKAAEELLEKGVAKRDDGAVIVEFDDEELGTVVLVTSEGYPLYSAKDLGLASLEFTEYDIDGCVHVVANEQTLHFKQVFELLKHFNEAWSENNHHMAYELVNLPSGKMSSRTGDIVTYDSLLREAVSRASEETRERHPDWNDERVEENAKSIALAALKYSMLSHDNNRVITFDLDRALELHGNTGPYIQYSHARAHGILEKAETEPGESRVTEDAEKELLKTVSKLPMVVADAAGQMKPNRVANYAYELAVSFNDFYEKCPVLKADEETRRSRLALVEAAATALKNALALLDIDAPEEM